MPTLTDAIAVQKKHIQNDLINICAALCRSGLALETLLPMVIAEACDEAKAIVAKKCKVSDSQVLDELIEAMGKALEGFAINHWQSTYVAPLQTQSGTYRSYGGRYDQPQFLPRVFNNLNGINLIKETPRSFK